ncbi:MAG: DPP IV N-terminal domain-containing protein [Thermaerobacter sp.]|nr:DPP IV N-terminal domain-containing protein [Thermaerobacter sp.]
MVRYSQLTLDQIATFPPPGTAGPQSLQFLEDAGAVAYLLPREESTTLDLWLYDLNANESRLLTKPPGEDDAYSLEEELRRERSRQAWGGITSYQITGGTLLVPHGGQLWHGRVGQPLMALQNAADAVDPRLFPDGRRVAFVREGDLHVLDLATGEVQALTTGAEPGFTHGLAEYAAQEELGRPEGYWIRPDGAIIAYAEADERHVPLYPISHQTGDPVWVEEHRYPLVGAENARVRLGTVSAAGGETTWYESAGEYLARAVWTPSGDLCAIWLDRLQRRAVWVLYRPGEPKAHPLFSEESAPWYNVNDDTRFLKTGEILYSSERTGVRRLYLRSADGAERALGSDAGNVNALLALDEDRRVAYYLGWDDDPTQRHIFAAALAGGAAERMTHAPGWHAATFSEDARTYVERFSSPEHPAVTVLRRIGAAGETVIHTQDGFSAQELGLVPPEIVRIPGADGTPLYGAIYRPTTPSADKLPLVVSVYGGTHAQMVTRAWELTADLEAQYMAQQGYVVWKLDGRGSYGRGLAFEAPLFERFGTVELDDQVAGVRYLAQHENVDPQRVGIYGWSYGGFMTLTALLKAPDVFKAGVAGAPVTDFRWYDTAYTERYMGLPGPNKDGYDGAALWPLADRLRGDLLIIHGLVDENVHFRHSARMISALIEADRPFEVQVLPESRHSVRGIALKRKVAESRTGFLKEHV